MSTKKGAGGLKYFSEESTGFKISPKTVLIMSLVYIGIVVLLHIYAKLGSSQPAKQSSSDIPKPEAASPDSGNTAGRAAQPEAAEAEETEPTGEDL